jgi:hypothetical protein
MMGFYQDRELKAHQAERDKALICGRGPEVQASPQVPSTKLSYYKAVQS